MADALAATGDQKGAEAMRQAFLARRDLGVTGVSVAIANYRATKKK